ncbi:hypothetical protein PG994_003889 [Apiospora phragmitis]|uniref:Uncharacterized protein n=1 Tax=Apiospora phragmitis TaxID=2905665 RepID=A0ABR1VZH5_9PEZI
MEEDDQGVESEDHDGLQAQRGERQVAARATFDPFGPSTTPTRLPSMVATRPGRMGARDGMYMKMRLRMK